MDIKQVIEAFKGLIPIYKAAIKNNEIPPSLCNGICRASYSCLNIDIYDIFKWDGYYKNYINGSYLFPTYYGEISILNTNKDSIKNSIIPRLKFM